MIISMVILVAAIVLLAYMAGRVFGDSLNSFGSSELVRGLCEVMACAICVAACVSIVFFLFTLVDLMQAGVL